MYFRSCNAIAYKEILIQKKLIFWILLRFNWYVCCRYYIVHTYCQLLAPNMSDRSVFRVAGCHVLLSRMLRLVVGLGFMFWYTTLFPVLSCSLLFLFLLLLLDLLAPYPPRLAQILGWSWCAWSPAWGLRGLRSEVQLQQNTEKQVKHGARCSQHIFPVKNDYYSTSKWLFLQNVALVSLGVYLKNPE